jgi:iron complex transport system ATP-binding protein
MNLVVRDLGLSIAQKRLCRGLSFQVKPGDLWCVLGRNGAGKTTLLRTLAGLRDPDEGAIELNGVALADWGRPELARTRGFMPQAQTDSFSCTVLETILTGRYPHQSRLAEQWRFAAPDDREASQSVLALLGLAELIDRDVLTLSGGERQRVALAALLVQDAPFMLLDEPTSHLDFDKQLRVMEVLQARLAGPKAACAVLMSVHDINLAARFATHILLFSDDACVLAGPVAEVLTATNLTLAYHHGVSEIATQGYRWFLPH